jgi:protein-S-isoprenylcysteine O-methyltransferase Ste14
MRIRETDMSEVVEQPDKSASPIGRFIVLIYGVISYIIGVVGLVAIVALASGLKPTWHPALLNLGAPIIVNFMLVALWGLVHSVMARDSFKAVLTRFIPEPAERPTYVLVAGVTSILMVGLWQQVPGVIWSAQAPALVTFLWVMFGFGWFYTLAATFAINHFDLFGLRQVYLHFQNQPRPALNFVKRGMYKFSRHPIQTGVLIGVWFIPTMTATHLILSIGFTVYIFIGLWFEEKDLIEEIGQPYQRYRREAGMFLPKLFK